MSANVHRVYNFNPGPAALPLEVLQQAQAEMVDYRGTGMSVMEISHRSKEFEAIIQGAEADLRELLGIPANYKVMFLQGGASLQFAMIPMNFRPAGRLGGLYRHRHLEQDGGQGSRPSWAPPISRPTRKQTASRTCRPNWNAIRKPRICISRPMRRSMEWSSLREPEAPAGVPLVCDASSDFVSRPWTFRSMRSIYGGAQKNAGPGRRRHCDRPRRFPGEGSGQPAGPPRLQGPGRKRFAAQHAPVLRDLYHQPGAQVDQGPGRPGAIAKRNQEKAALVYKTIDESGGFYRGHAKLGARSVMNIPFRLPT